MTTTEFCYWLNGHIELGGERPSEAQWNIIKEHLGLVFKKVTNPLISFNPETRGVSYCCSNTDDFTAKNFFKDFAPTGHPPFNVNFKNVHGEDIIEHSC